MFVEYNDNGKIMICADSMIRPNMVEFNPPDGFIAEEMHKWVVADGEIVSNPDWVEPTPMLTQEERIAALEDELAATKILLGVE